MAKLYIREGTGNWWASFANPSGGQTIRRSTGIPCQQSLKDKAQLKANQMELEAWESWTPGGKQEDYLYDEMMVLFIQDTKPGRGHFDNIKQLTKYFGGMRLSEIAAQQIAGYKRFRSHVSDGTVRRELSVLSSAYSHVRVQYDWKAENPVTGRLPKKSQSKLRWYRPPEAKAIHPELYEDLADYFLLGLATGMRKGELSGMSVERCDFTHHVFHFDPDQQKGRRHDTLPMNQISYEVAKRRAEKSKDGDLFPFAYPRKGYMGAHKRCNVEGATIHTMRHTFASWMVQHGVPLREVQDLMRHASITETEKYAHLAPKTEVHYLHSVVYRPGQGLEVIDNVLQNQVLAGRKWSGRPDLNRRPPHPQWVVHSSNR
ncbi:MAG: site-specific integrase [Gammaproteobacteria bacterium]|nr:MAG: site-specific integrase [Gammaproteobacteria bacterium]